MKYVGVDIFTAMSLRMPITGDVMLHSWLSGFKHCEGTWCFHLQGYVAQEKCQNRLNGGDVWARSNRLLLVRKVCEPICEGGAQVYSWYSEKGCN
jgi:hypothetical protein